MTKHVFVDETKQRGYVLVAVFIRSRDLVGARSLLHTLVLPGQRRIHMAKESDRRRRLIITAIKQINLSAIVYDAGRQPSELQARMSCIRALIDDAVHHGAQRLVVDRDDSLLAWDRQRLIEGVRRAHIIEALAYEHLKASDEPLLALPDALAWCWARSSAWRSRIEPMISATRRV